MAILFATYDDMRRLGREPGAFEFSKSAASSENKTVFLSHSSKDGDLVPGAILVLENHGGRVYVDNRDPFLDENDCLAIAGQLRQRIRATRKFVLLATPISKGSIWMPWELGLADGMRGPTEIAIFPSAESWADQQWADREYLGLYRRIVYGDHESYSQKIWMVIDHRTRAAVELRDWLTS